MEQNIVYKFDDRLHNKVPVIDQLMFHYIFTKSDKIHVSDCFRLLNQLNPREDISLLEHIYLDITHWKEKHFIDDIPCTDHDRWREIIVHFEWKDKIPVIDKVKEYTHVYSWGEHIPVSETLHPSISMYKKDDIKVEEAIYFNRTYEPDPIT